MNVASPPRFDVDALRDLAGDKAFARGEACAAAARLIAHMADLRSPAEPAVYVGGLKDRHHRRRNFMKLLG